MPKGVHFVARREQLWARGHQGSSLVRHKEKGVAQTRGSKRVILVILERSQSSFSKRGWRDVSRSGDVTRSCQSSAKVSPLKGETLPLSSRFLAAGFALKAVSAVGKSQS